MEILIINLIDMYSLIERLVFWNWKWISNWLLALNYILNGCHGHSWIFTKISLFFAVIFVSSHFTNELLDSCQLLIVSLQTKITRKNFLIDFESSTYLILIDNCSQGCYFKTSIKTAVKLASNVNFDSFSQQVTSK